MNRIKEINQKTFKLQLKKDSHMEEKNPIQGIKSSKKGYIQKKEDSDNIEFP